MSKKGKKGKKKIAGLMLFLGWMIFILLAVVFYFYFFSDLDLRMFNKDKATQTDAQQTNQTGFSYETNANLDINSLIIEYYAALAVCDQDKLKTYVTDPSQFDDMTVYQQRSAVIKAYSNVNCYTMPGYTEDATLVYVTSNLSMANITSVPLNINQFYVVKTADGYKIDNSAHSQEVTNYIETQSQSTDIQNLYKAVQDNVNSCIAMMRHSQSSTIRSVPDNNKNKGCCSSTALLLYPCILQEIIRTIFVFVLIGCTDINATWRNRSGEYDLCFCVSVFLELPDESIKLHCAREAYFNQHGVCTGNAVTLQNVRTCLDKRVEFRFPFWIERHVYKGCNVIPERHWGNTCVIAGDDSAFL